MKTRPPASAPAAHVAHLDGWRGLAITLLLVGHFAPVPGINLGTAGVNFFFVLSGYLMGQLLFVRETPIAVFYRRRISRIVPAHLVFVGSMVALALLLGRAVDWRQTLAALFFVNNYVMPLPGAAEMPFGHIWSLSVEEHSYVLLSLLAVASRRRWADARWTVGAFAALFGAIGFYYWTRHSGRRLDFELWLHTEVSAFGIFASAAALVVLTSRGRLPRLPAVAYLAMAGAGLALHWWSVPNPVRTVLGVGLLALTVNLLAAAPQSVKSALSFAPLRQLGIWSFSLYLWQQPFYLWMHHGDMPLAVALAGTFACGLASYYLVEQPVRSYLNAHWGRGRAGGSATSSAAGLPGPARPSRD